jgi:hypothetical protein
MSFQRNLRYDSLAQIERFKRAAKLKRWSLNTFIITAAEAAASAIEQEARGKTKQLIHTYDRKAPSISLQPACENCSEPATHQRLSRDTTFDERGPMTTEYWEWVCDKCDPEGAYDRA